MKHYSFEPVKEWFGFSRRERRASFILLILIIVITGFRYFIPSKSLDVEEIPVEIPESSKNSLTDKKTSNPVASVRKGMINRQRPLLDLNSCDSASLEALPGIGPVLSARIIRYRNLLGGFAYVDQLREVYGLSAETFNLIEGRLTADSTEVRKIKVNTADYRQLIRLPYLERNEVSAILKYRELYGKITVMSELVENKLIAPEKAERIRPYLEFGE